MKRFSAILLLICLSWTLLHSQTPAKTPSAADIHKMNAAILVTIDEYIQYTSLTEADDIKAFPGLFVAADSACVYNDVPGTVGFNSMISPNTYAGLISQGSGCIIQTDISKLRKEGPFRYDGKYWHRPISIDKYVMFIDNTLYSGESGGIFFDSDYIFGKGRGTYHLIFDMCCDPESGRCRIASITHQGSDRSSPVAQDSFCVVLKTDNPKYAKYEHRTLYNGQPLTYNEYGQGFVGSPDDISFADENYEIRVNEQAASPLYKIVTLDYHRFNHFRIKPRFSTTLGKAFSVKKSLNEAGGFFKVASNASEFGVDFGSLFISGKGFHAGLYVGAAISNSNFTASATESFSYTYPDPAFNPTFNRTFRIDEANETIKFVDAVVPVYLETEFSLGKMFDISFDLGAKAYLNLDNKDYYSVSFLSGFPKYDLNSNDDGFLFPSSYAKEAYDFSLFANLEADVRITDKIFGFLSAGYEYGLYPIFNRDTDVQPYYYPDHIFPVINRGDNVLMRHSFAGTIQLHRSSVWLNLGVKFKLKK